MTTTDRQAWLEQRRLGIGGSDVAPILGLSKWRTPLDVYLDKRGEGHEDQDNEPMLWGRALEPVIRQQYADRTGRTVLVPDRMLVHPQHGFMIANVDGLTEDRRVFEAKNARSGQGWGEPGTDEIPEAYYLQTQHYLAVTTYTVADIAVLIGGSDFRIYHVEADTGLQADMIEAEAAFWQRVLDGTPPDPVSFTDAVQRYGRSAAVGAVEADAEVLAAHRKLVGIRHALAQLEEQEAEQKAVLVRALGEAGDTLVANGRTLATWKLAKAPQRFDTTRFKASHPDLYSQFTAAGEPSRRLLLKEPE